jgi:hypothetical protein
LCLFIALFSCTTAFAADDDVVVLKNGDRITGEVLSLIRGKLEFDTDSMGTVYIEWEDVMEVQSEVSQSIELADGQRFFGPIKKTGNSEMVGIETESGLVGVEQLEMIAMYPVEASFADRLDFSSRLGFSWDKGSDVGKYNLGATAKYREEDYITRADFQLEITTQDTEEDTTRSSLGVDHFRFRQPKRFTTYFGNFEKNDQLGLDLRALAGIGYGWSPIQSHRNLFLVIAGLDVNHEIPDDGDSETNLEAVGRLRYEYFRYSGLERSLTSQLSVYPGLTDTGRWRADFTTEFDMDLTDDFSWIFSVYANYDSDPISTDGSNSDYGVVSSVEYDW